jgi:hypothetical protein
MTRPVARPLASSGPRERPWTAGGSDSARTMNHSRDQSSLSRISPARLDLISAQLTPLDQAVITLASRTRLCSGGQLQRLFWPGGDGDNQARRARRALGRLTDWRVLDRLPRPVGGTRAGSKGFLYVIGPAGARLLERQLGTRIGRLIVPGQRFIAHTLAIAEVVVGLHAAAARGDCDLIEFQCEPTCWRPFPGPMGARLVLRPDLFVRIGRGAYEDHSYLEIDLATEGRGTLLAKCRRYLAHYRSGEDQRQHGLYPKIVWAVPNAGRLDLVASVIAELPAEAQRLFDVCLLASVTAHLTNEECS